jgi:hypothetical protein
LIRKVHEEFPPLTIDPDRNRPRDSLSLLETGKVTNPTFGTLRTLAHALNKHLLWTLVDDPAGAGL